MPCLFIAERSMRQFIGWLHEGTVTHLNVGGCNAVLAFGDVWVLTDGGAVYDRPPLKVQS